MARTSITLVLELDETMDSPAGSARLPDGTSREFHGWLGLTEAIDSLARKAVDPPDPDLELHGLLIGSLEPPDPDVDPPDPDVDPPDPDMPARMLLGNFSALLGEGATFPHLKGSVGDPTGLTASPAVLLPAEPACEQGEPRCTSDL